MSPPVSHGPRSGRSSVGQSSYGYFGYVRHYGKGTSSLDGPNEACPLPNKTAVAVADAFFQLNICRYGVPAVIHLDQGREIENHFVQELCLLLGAHKTHTTPYHPASDGVVERLNHTLLMMLTIFAGAHRDDWDDLLPAVMIAIP